MNSRMKEKKLLIILLSVIYLLLAIHGAALVFYLYWIYPWFDLLTHYIGGVWVGFAAVWLLYYSQYRQPKPILFTHSLVRVMALVALVGILWEVYEIVTLLALQAEIPGNYTGDSILDLIMDMLGALTAYIAARYLSLVQPD